MNSKNYRYELKYEVSLASAALLRSLLGAFMHPDPHAGPGGYQIRSLYFDDIDYSAYRDKIDGIRDRSKLRLRYYNGDESYIIFENKEKLGDLTRKTTQRISKDTALAMIRRMPFEGDSGSVVRLYKALAASTELQPRVIVDYKRIPFVYNVSNVRITIDMDVSAAPFKTDLFDRSIATIPVLDEGTAILEVKYDEFLPPQLAAALNTVPMTRIASSKYVKCLGVLE